MRRNTNRQKAPAEKVMKDIRRATRRQYGAEEKIRIGPRWYLRRVRRQRL